MSETENVEDTVQTGARMVEASRVFSHTSMRALEFLGNISTVRQTIEKTMPFGQSVLEIENTESVLAILRDTKLAKIFKDPAAMMQGEKYVEFAKNITAKSMASASSLVSAASLVFAHAVFDSTLFEYCRVTALWAWRDWVEIVKDRKVSIGEVQTLTKFGALLNSIEKCLEQLEKESILKKADMLHRVIKPGNYLTTVRDYAYSRERLDAIDRARHEAVHRLQFREGFVEIEKTIDYLRRTVVHFIGLIHFRYGLKIDTSVAAGENSKSERN